MVLGIFKKWGKARVEKRISKEFDEILSEEKKKETSLKREITRARNEQLALMQDEYKAIADETERLRSRRELERMRQELEDIRNEEYDDEEEDDTSNDMGSPEQILMATLAPILAQKLQSQNQQNQPSPSPQTPQPHPETEYSEEQIKELISKVPQEHIQQLRKLPQEQQHIILKNQFPETSLKTREMAIAQINQ